MDVEKAMDDLGKEFAKLQKAMNDQQKNSERSYGEVKGLTKEKLVEARNRRKQLTQKSSLLNKIDQQVQFFEEKKQKVLSKKKKTSEQQIQDQLEYSEYMINQALTSIYEATEVFYDAIELADNYNRKEEK